MTKKNLITATVLGGLVAAVPFQQVRADIGDTLRADAAKIDADITQLQADQQKLRQLVVPDKTALAAAQKQYDTDAAPLDAKLKTDEQQFHDSIKTRREAINAVRQQGETVLKAMEDKLAADRQHAARDKSVAAQIPPQEAAMKTAREKLKQDIKAQQEKLEADVASGNQNLDAERRANAATLKPDTDALTAARQKLQSDLTWETKVAADQATLEADKLKLSQDKQAAGQ